MRNLPDIGRIFFGVAVAGLGLQTIYYDDLPYMLIPPEHAWIPGLAIIAYISGAMLILAGGCLAFKKNTGLIALVLGVVLLLIFCFYFIPFQLVTSSDYLELGKWENAEKELAISGGSFIIAGSFSKTNELSSTRFVTKLFPSCHQFWH